MRDSVKAVILPWLAQFEGSVPWMYLDIYGRVACGIGTDINSPSAALQLEWHWKNGQRATPSEVTREWCGVQAMQGHTTDGGGSATWRDRAQLTVGQASLAAYTATLFGVYEALLILPERIGPAWPTLPGVVQLARLRTSYADGESAALDGWPALDWAIRCERWEDAARECMPKDLGRQNASYKLSYHAVQDLYLLADAWPGEDMPSPLPNGTERATQPDA
jgi:hypothetical protein